MTGRMRQQTEAAVAEAAAVLFVIDARAGVTPLDAHFANWLRRQGRPVILLANKCEGGAGRGGMAEAYGLSFGRSEEHTSELQSLLRTSYAGFCLKKQNQTSKKKKDEH